MDWLRIVILLLVPFIIQGYTWRRGEGKLRLRYGCLMPPVPKYGYFEYNDEFQEIGYKCKEGYILTKLTEVYWRKCEHGKWSGSNVGCFLDHSADRKCPDLRPPNNGNVSVYEVKSVVVARFRCKAGFIMLGDEYMRCGSAFHWTGQIPECKPYKNVADYTRLLQDKFIDTFKGSTADSSGLQGKLAAGKLGLDLVFALDTSASVGAQNLELAKDFIMSLVKQFGVAKYANGTTANGNNNGTRMALITFNDTAKLRMKLDDPDVRSVKAVKKALKNVTKTGGGTDFFAPLNLMVMKFKKIEDKTRALFFVTDSQANKHSKTDRDRLRSRANLLKKRGFEVFAIGIGNDVDIPVLDELATPPSAEHVFKVENFDDLKTMTDIIAEKNIDYGQCGISGDTSANMDAKKGAWPWVAWLAVTSQDLSLTCGGTLICDRWLITAAHCVSKGLGVNDTAPHVVDKSHVNVHLGDHQLYGKQWKADNGIVVPVTRIFVHPNYTGHLTEEGVRPFDVALLYLGNKTQSTRPVLNKYIRPICFPTKGGAGSEKSVYDQSVLMLWNHRTSNSPENGYLVGWGHTGQQKVFSRPRKYLAQSDTPIQLEKRCSAEFPNLDQSMFICVGREAKTSTKCFDDIGGAYYAEIKPTQKRMTMLGVNLDRTKCSPYSIFLNIFHPEINAWITDKLGNCSRVGKKPAPTEEEDDEYEDRVFQRGKFAVPDEQDIEQDNLARHLNVSEAEGAGDLDVSEADAAGDLDVSEADEAGDLDVSEGDEAGNPDVSDADGAGDRDVSDDPDDLFDYFDYAQDWRN